MPPSPTPGRLPPEREKEETSDPKTVSPFLIYSPRSYRRFFRENMFDVQNRSEIGDFLYVKSEKNVDRGPAIYEDQISLVKDSSVLVGSIAEIWVSWPRIHLGLLAQMFTSSSH